MAKYEIPDDLFYTREDEVDGVTVNYPRKLTLPGARLGHRNADAFLLGIRGTVRRIHEEWPFDVIHAHDWTTFRAGLALRAATGRPLVAHVHITEFDKSGGSYADPTVYALEREGIAGADRVVAVSRRIAHTCCERYGADPARMRVVYNAVDEAEAGAPPPPGRRASTGIVMQ